MHRMPNQFSSLYLIPVVKAALLQFLGGCYLLRGSCRDSLVLQFSWTLESAGQLGSDQFSWNQHIFAIATSWILGTLTHPVGLVMGILFPCQCLSQRDTELPFLKISYIISLWRHSLRTPRSQEGAGVCECPAKEWKGFSLIADRRKVHAWQSLQKKALINTCHLWQAQVIPTLTGLCMDSHFSFDNWTVNCNFTRTESGISVYASFERHQNEQGSVCRALGAPRCSSQDKGHCSDKQQQVINYKHLIGLTGPAWRA